MHQCRGMIFLENFSEGSSSATIIADKFVIVAGENQESPQTLQGFWLGPILHFLYIFWIKPHTFTTHDVSQIIDFFHAKRALGQFDK